MADPFQTWIAQVDPAAPGVSFYGVDRSLPVPRLEGFFSYPRCRVPHAGRCPESLLDAWDLDDTGPPDTTCLCEGGVCHG